MKTAVWVMVYFAICFLMFTGWMFGFAQYTPFNGQEKVFSLTYLLNLFFLHIVMEPYYHFFKIETYSNALMSLADDSGQMIRFHQTVPVLWIYSLSALLTFVVYIISAKWFTHNRVKGKYLTK
ncbi:TPA: hypothetical protein NPN33_004764 [Klebsiella variicola subsp. variicola]|nr:hypothetical protein [Klebsiella variicola subsp. variicola]